MENIRNKKLNKKYNLLITAIPFIPIIKRFEKIKKRNKLTLLKVAVSKCKTLKIIQGMMQFYPEMTKLQKVIDKAINLK